MSRLTLASGVIFALSGAAILGYIALSIWTLLEDPSSVELIQYLLALVSENGPAIWGSHPGGDYSLHLSDTAQTVILLFSGVFVFSILASIGKSFLSVGLQLMRFALHPEAQPVGDDADSS